MKEIINLYKKAWSSKIIKIKKKEKKIENLILNVQKVFFFNPINNMDVKGNFFNSTYFFNFISKRKGK